MAAPAAAAAAQLSHGLLARSRAMCNAVGTAAAQLDTPALVIDLDAMERNMATMKAFVHDRGLLLRPHAKMHKSPEMARMLMQRGGAVGVCVQKVGEAEALVDAGVHDIFVSNEVVHPAKLARLAMVVRSLAMMHPEAKATPTEPRLSICCDCPEGVDLLATALLAEYANGSPMLPVGVFLEIDVGQLRCGAPPAGERAVATVEAIVQHAKTSPAPIFFAGIHAYQGTAQHFRTPAERQAAVDAVVASAVATRDLLKERLGVDTPLVTGAGTGTFPLEAASGVYGELQPGSYLVMDRDYGDNGKDPAHPVFEHALFVASRVMSLGTRPGAAVLDAGHKSHAIDSGLPTVHGRPDVQFVNGGDEHGIVVPKEAGGETGLRLNDLVFLIPGHCDPTFNLHDRAFGIRGGLQEGSVERIFTIDARGCAS